MFNLTDSRRLIENRLKCDFTAAEIQGPGKQIRVLGTNNMKPMFNKPKNFTKGVKNLRTYKLVPGYWISAVFSPSKNSLRKKEISSSTQQIHTRNTTVERNKLLTVCFRVSKLCGAAPEAKPYLCPTLFRQ